MVENFLQAVILAGGLGKRLRPLTDSMPKPMVGVGGVPILERQMLWLRKYGIKEVILCVGYKREVIGEYFGDGRKLGIHIDYSFEKEQLGTGGALKNAEQVIGNQNFVLMYGDIMTDLDLYQLIGALDSKSEAVMAAFPLRSPFGVLKVNGDNVCGFIEKPTLKEYWMNAGVFCLSPGILKTLPQKGSLESITLERLAAEGKLKMVRYSNSSWRSIDSHKDIEEAEREFEQLSPMPETMNVIPVNE